MQITDSNPSPATPEMLFFETLLEAAQALDPSVRKIDYILKFDGQMRVAYWAHSSRSAFCGDTPDALLSDIRHGSWR